MTDNKLKGIVFDLDGVITDTAFYHFLAWKKIVVDYKILLTEDVNEQVKGLPRRATLIKIFELYKTDLPNESVILEMLDQKNAYYRFLLQEKLNEGSISDGILNFLEQAKKQNLKMAIASSSFNAPFILEKLKIKDYFDFVVNPKTVKNQKPAGDIYLAAAAGIGLKHNECIGLEDARIGIVGLKEAKIFAVGINESDSFVKENSDFYVASTKELDLKKIEVSFNLYRF